MSEWQELSMNYASELYVKDINYLPLRKWMLADLFAFLSYMDLFFTKEAQKWRVVRILV